MSPVEAVELAVVALVAASLALFAWDRARRPATDERTVGAIFSNPYLRILAILLMVLVVLRAGDARPSLTWLPAIVVLIIGTTVAGADFILLLVALLKNNELFIRLHYELERERFLAQTQALPTSSETVVVAPRAAPEVEVDAAEQLEPVTKGLDVIRLGEAPAAAVPQEDVRVALISCGVPDEIVEHPAFAGRVERTFGAEGTVVLEAIGSAGVGFVAAIAPSARILPITVFDSSYAATDDRIAEGLDAALAWDAEVVVLDFGGTQPSEAINQVINRSSDRILFVAPAGNNGEARPAWPASEPKVLGVAAVDRQKNLAPFSSYGRSVRVAAPGVAVVSVVGVQGERLAFREQSGTSFAADITAGAAALALSVKKMTPSELTKELISSGSSVVGRRSLRVLDAAALMERVVRRAT